MPSLLEDIVNEDDDDLSANEVAASAIDAVNSSRSLSQPAGHVAKRDAISLLLVTASFNCRSLVGISLSPLMILPGTALEEDSSRTPLLFVVRDPSTENGLAARFKLF